MIYLDHRFGSKQDGHKSYHDLRPELSKLKVQHEVIDIGFADVMFSGNGPVTEEIPSGNYIVGVEIKTLDDLLGSMESKRLQTGQLPKMMENCQRRYLLIIGMYSSTPSGQLRFGKYNKDGKFYWWTVKYGQRTWHFSQLTNFLAAAQVFYGADLIVVPRVDEAARAIVNLYGWWNKSWDEHTTIRVMPPKMVGVTYTQPPDVAIVAASVKRMGWRRSMEAAKKWPTILEMAAATAKDWQEIEGVGKTLAKAAVRFFQGDSA